MTLRRICLAILAVIPVWCAPALADPALRVDIRPEGVRVQLDGSFPGCTYAVLRAESPGGIFHAITSANVLCLGDCSAWDAGVLPGRTVYYRFDLVPPDGLPVSFGPYAVAIPRQLPAVRVSPNPSLARTRIDVTPPVDPDGSPAFATVRIMDAMGRTIRTLHAGAVPRSGLALTWDGRDDGGRPAGPGIYLVHMAAARGSAATRLIRIQ